MTHKNVNGQIPVFVPRTQGQEVPFKINRINFGGFREFLIYLIILMAFLIVGCASGHVLSDSATSSLARLQKKPIRVLVTSESDSILHLACKESFGTIFTLVESSPYDMKVVSRVTKYDLKPIYENVSGSGNDYTCKGKYRLLAKSKIDIYDANDNLQFTKEESGDKVVETYALALNGATARQRSRGEAAGRANSEVFSQVAVNAVHEFYESPRLTVIARVADEAQKAAEKDKINPSEKLPIECMVLLPPNLASIKATAFFDRSFVVNKERQSGTADIAIGEQYAKILLDGLGGRFASVVNMTAETSGKHIAHNPHSLACILEVQLDTPIVTENRVTIPVKIAIKSPTGGTFKNADVSSEGSMQLSSTGGQMLGSIASGVSILRAAFSGTIVTSALRNGTEEAIKRSVQKTASIFQPSFAKAFAEFSSYDAALKTRSPTDMKAFLQLYPDSSHKAEVELLLDDLSFEYAQSSGSMELFVDYLRAMPNGRHSTEARKAAVSNIVEQIKDGNLALCELYCEISRNGANNEQTPVNCTCRR